MTKYSSLYNQGMTPSVFSLERYKHKRTKWHRVSNEVEYKRILRRGRPFYTLEFEYEFEYDNDTVWFATSIPYTYSMLLKYIKSIEDRIVNPIKEVEEKSKLGGMAFGEYIKPKKAHTN